MNSISYSLIRKLKRINAFMSKYYLYDFFMIMTVFYFYNELKTIEIEDISVRNQSNKQELVEIIDFEGFDNEKGLDKAIIPNIIHYLLSDQTEMSHNHLISILAANYYQKPSAIYIHAKEFKVKEAYLDVLNRLEINWLIRVKRYEPKRKIFGKNIEYENHFADLKRLEILMEYGGIYLDSSAVLSESLDKYRGYESVVCIRIDEIDNKVVMANKNARFFKAWYDKYRTNYSVESLNYNSKKLPALILKDYAFLSKTTKLKYINNENALNSKSDTESVIKLWKNPDDFIKEKLHDYILL